MTTKPKILTRSVLLVLVVGAFVLLSTTVELPAGPCVVTSTPPAPPAEPTEPAAADESGDPTGP